MFDESHYVPILKWKRGEQVGLQNLSLETKARLTPLIEIIPKDNLDDLIRDIPRTIQTYWGIERPIFVDLNLLGDLEPMTDGRHPLNYLGDEAQDLQIIPVTGFDRIDSFQEAIRLFHQETGRGICIRITDEHFMDIDSQLSHLIDTLQIEPQQVDLILDLFEINPNDEGRTVIAATFAINSLPNVDQWRSLTIAGSSFPRDLSAIPSGTDGVLPRTEWAIWTQLYQRRQTINRMPTFSDYTINNPVFIEIDPRIMNMAANIRYTSENRFLIFRGRSIRREGWGQVRDLARRVIEHTEYSGPTYCWGDEYIFHCATGEEGTGNAETWRRVGTNHHLTLAVNVLSNFFGT